METALIVEDSITDREIIKICLEQEGFSVCISESGEDALDKIDTNKPSLIILDIVLPNRSGFEICRILKDSIKTSHIPIILCSNKNSEMDKYWGIKQGADYYLAKPISKEDLIAILKHYRSSDITISKTFNDELLEKPNMIEVSSLQNKLQDFIVNTPQIEGAILVSPDGLPITAVLPDPLDEERTAAMSAAMLSLGDRIAFDLARGAIERVLVEGEKGYSILVGCGEEVALLILATKEAKQGIVFLAIKRLVEELLPMLD
ncbi:MAG: response regulator [Prochloraceae cyanobacterium]